MFTVLMIDSLNPVAHMDESAVAMRNISMPEERDAAAELVNVEMSSMSILIRTFRYDG